MSRFVEQWELPRNFESFLPYALGGGYEWGEAALKRKASH
jgi:hypothetical protein